MNNNLKKIFNVVYQPLLCLTIIGVFLFGSVKWAQFNQTFVVKDVKIEGINYFDDTVLTDYKQSIKDQNIFLSNLKGYKSDIESLDHIKGCKISRVFPSTVEVEVYEREPLAMISANDLIILDSEGICLPV
jgi:cell division septal protein FtsQ